MRKLKLICLIMFVCIGITQNCFSELGYPSIYKFVSFKDQFNAQTLIDTGNVYPSIDMTKSYLTDASEIRTFRVFFPKGAKKVTMLIDFIGWPWQECTEGATLRYWVGTTIPSVKGTVSNDLWSGKYMERTSGTQDTTIAIASENNQPSERAVWIYFAIHNPVSCPSSYCIVKPTYELDLDSYALWYNSVTNWESNGDPPYDASIPPNPNFDSTNTTTTITIGSSATTINEGDTIRYTATIPSAQSNSINISFSLYGTNITSSDYTIASNIITIPAGQVSGTQSVYIENDGTQEGNETITAVFVAPTGYSLSGNNFVTTIIDSGSTGIIPVSIVPSALSVNEGNTLYYTATIPSSTSTPVSISFTLGGTGIDGSDYSPNSNLAITIPANATQGTSQIITISEDKTTEGDEALVGNFTVATEGYAISGNPSQVTINDTSTDTTAEFIDVASVASGLKISSTEAPHPGATVSISDSNQNLGTVASGQLEVSYYLVRDSDKALVSLDNIGDYGILLKNEAGDTSRVIENIPAGSSETESVINLVIPETGFTTEKLIYYFDNDKKPWIVKVINPAMQVSESSYANNLDYVRFEQDFALADLFVDDVEVSSIDRSANTITVTAKIGNNGTYSAGNAEVAFYMLSSDLDVKEFFSNKDDSGKLFAKIPSSGTVQYIGSTSIENVDPNGVSIAISPTLLNCPSCFSGEESFRILAMVNSRFVIPESNSYNNFGKDLVDASNIDIVSWGDISGASNSVSTVPQIPLLKLSEFKLTEGQNSRFSAGDNLTVQYKIVNSGSDFVASENKAYIALYLSEDATLDINSDKKVGEVAIGQDIESEMTSEQLQSTFVLAADQLPGTYYVFAVLSSENGITSTESQNLEINIVKLFVHSASPRIEEITGSLETAPVYLGDMVSGGSNSTLTVKFPAYSEPVDHYIAIMFPNGRLMFVKNDPVNIFTSDYAYYITNISNALTATVLENQSIVNNGLTYPAMLGTWWVFWLTAPAGNSGLQDIIDKGDYELGYYQFTVSPGQNIE